MSEDNIVLLDFKRTRDIVKTLFLANVKRDKESDKNPFIPYYGF